MSQVEFGYYMECSIALAVDLANTFDPATGRNDHLPDIGALSAFLATHKVSPAGRVRASDVEQTHEVAAKLRAVFDASEEAEAAGILNGLLEDSGARPELTDHNGGPWHLHYGTPGARFAQRLAAEAAMALSVIVAADGFERLRVCAGDRCEDAFVDQSRNRSRLYCSPKVCGNRASVAAFRARRRHEHTA